MRRTCGDGTGVTVSTHPRHVRTQVAVVEGDLEPGDHIVAETLGEAGRAPRWEGPASYLAKAIAACGFLAAAAALLIAGKQAKEQDIVAVCVAPYCILSVLAPRRKPTYIVVTTSRVYLIPLATRRRDRDRAITKTPVGCVRISQDRAGRFRRVIQLEGPAFPLRGLQFLVTGPWRADVDSVLTAIRTPAEIHTAPPAAGSLDRRW